MTTDNLADRIEEAIGHTFAHSRSFELAPSEYSLFYAPHKDSSWFIVIYFTDRTMLRTALKQGACYQLYLHLQAGLDKLFEDYDLDISITFESGNRPTEMQDMEAAIDRLVARRHGLQQTAGKADIQICGNCGHDFNQHQLMSYLNEENSTPTDGWIICPEEDCNCFQTWGANYNPEQE